ncbi:MAG TPA: hypothetical protein VJU61_29025, partial [Polyangiaceae bacterium]|nr:hypothetical protein [Polyangiaceae bacterium]
PAMSELVKQAGPEDTVAREQQVVRRALVFGVLGLSLLIAIAGRELDQRAIELALRLQGRLSFVLYIAALIGPGLRARMGSAAAAWLARRRSPLYLAFALSHLIHAVWIVLYFQCTSASFSWNIPDCSGVLAFPAVAVLLYAQTPHGQRHLPARARVEASIVAYVWVQFVGFFIDRMLTPERVALRPWYTLALAVSAAAAFVALYPVAGRRGPAPSASPAS